jgi:hypothetical protein
MDHGMNACVCWMEMPRWFAARDVCDRARMGATDGTGEMTNYLRSSSFSMMAL